MATPAEYAAAAWGTADDSINRLRNEAIRTAVWDYQLAAIPPDGSIIGRDSAASRLNYAAVAAYTEQIDSVNARTQQMVGEIVDAGSPEVAALAAALEPLVRAWITDIVNSATVPSVPGTLVVAT